MQYTKTELRRKISVTTWAILALGLLLLASLAYIIYGTYSDYSLEKDQEIFTAGYNQGITAATVALYQQTDTCQPVGIFIEDKQKQVIDVKCLQQQ